MSAEQIQLLKHFVKLSQENPDLLHNPNFEFYRTYLESMGATIPPPKQSSAAGGAKAETKSQPKASAEDNAKREFEEQQEEEDEPALPLPELDNSGVMEDQTGDEEYPMGDPEKEVSEEDLEKANEHRDMAAAAFNEGDYQKALELYTKAIELNPGSAILHAKRACTLLKKNKLKAAIKDCDKAISINPDSAAPYKFRGRAHRLLGNWLEAHKDLAISCKLDYDDLANEWLKEVEPNAKKLHDYERTKERRKEEKELRDRRERINRAREANKRAAKASMEEDVDEDMGAGAGGGFGMGPFQELFKELSDDPELLAALKNDPTLIGKLMEIMQNPANMMKHMGDPNVQKLLAKLGNKMGAAGPAAGFPEEADGGAAPSGGGGGGFKPAAGSEGPTMFTNEPNVNISFGGNTNTTTKKVPEPDLD